MSIADKLHNARAILADNRRLQGELWARFNAPRDDVLWYYRALLEAHRAVNSSPLVDELARVVEELERLVAEHEA